METLNAAAFSAVLVSSGHQLCGNSLGKAQRFSTPMHEARTMQKWVFKFGLGKLDCPAQIPDINLVLWAELEHQL